MSSTCACHISRRQIPQSEPIPGTSLSVQLSHLRAKGLKIKTLCGKAVRDGITIHRLIDN